MVGYFRSHIPHFAEKAFPLTELLKKSKPDKVVWTDVEQKAFKSLRGALISKPILQAPDFSKGWIIQCDASYKSLGSALLQAATADPRN